MSDKVIARRAKLVKHMHSIICSLNNETAYYAHWILIVPDEADQDDFLDIAADDDLYDETCKLFRELIKKYGDDGFYIWEDKEAH